MQEALGRLSPGSYTPIWPLIPCNGPRLSIVAGQQYSILLRETFFEPQCSGSLGRRMQAAFVHMFRPGAKSAILIGSDCPLLERKLVRQAFTALKNNDLVLGPAADGGYYLIGLRRPVPELFQLRQWSHPGVLEATLNTASKLNLTCRILPTLSDIDQGEDLPQLGRELLAAWLKCRNGRRKDFPLRVFRRLFWEPGTQIYNLATTEPHQLPTEKRPGPGKA